jgi:multisubunit Na+/H+ antiporter MnhF subunit
LIQIIASLTVSIWHWRQARRAQRHIREKRTRHDAGYGAMVLLPMYTAILWVFAIGDLIRGSFMLLMANHIVTDEITVAILVGIGFFVAHVPNEGLAFALTRQSAGWGTVRRVAMLSLIQTALFAVFAIYLIYDNNEAYFNISYSLLAAIFYLVLWLTPSNRLFRRPSLRNYARYMALVASAVAFVNLLHLYYGSIT